MSICKSCLCSYPSMTEDNGYCSSCGSGSGQPAQDKSAVPYSIVYDILEELSEHIDEFRPGFKDNPEAVIIDALKPYGINFTF